MNDESRTITDAQDGIDLHDFLGVKPEKPWKKWAVRGGIGALLVILLLLLSRCFPAAMPCNMRHRSLSAAI